MIRPDDWSPLRCCWGGSDGGGWSGEGGGMSGYGGGGDWGSAGVYSAAGFDAGGIGQWGGTAYDASVNAGFSPAGGGGDWGSFGPTSYSGSNLNITTLSPYDVGLSQTGGGDWGSSGIYSAAGLNVDPGASNVSSGFYGGDTGRAFDTATGAYSGYSPYASTFGGNLYGARDEGGFGTSYSGGGFEGGYGGGTFSGGSGGGGGGG